MMKWLSISWVIILFFGCANHTAGIMANSVGEERIDNQSFSTEVQISGVQSRYHGDLQLGVATISSKVATDLKLQYKFSWYDTAGFIVEGESNSWQSIKLHGMQRVQVSSVAPNSSATQFEVYVREVFSN